MVETASNKKKYQWQNPDNIKEIHIDLTKLMVGSKASSEEK